MKPIVGITAWRRRLDTFYGPDRLHTLSTFYADAVIDAGMTPLVIPAGQVSDDADKIVSLIDGLLLSGGDDVDPASYGEPNTASAKVDPDVDRFEIALIAAARAQRKPVLGICRGLQILNVAHGGTIAQEVTAEGTPHEPFVPGTDPEIWNERRHTVEFEEDSLMREVYRSEHAKVNTLHHQGIARLGSDLVAEGRSDDGLIEAFRSDGDWWMLGVQWHPERMDLDHRGVFAAFREAILASRV